MVCSSVRCAALSTAVSVTWLRLFASDLAATAQRSRRTCSALAAANTAANEQRRPTLSSVPAPSP
eukprot:5106955-Prymnesium_polylepis.2